MRYLIFVLLAVCLGLAACVDRLPDDGASQSTIAPPLPASPSPGSPIVGPAGSPPAGAVSPAGKGAAPLDGQPASPVPKIGPVPATGAAGSPSPVVRGGSPTAGPATIPTADWGVVTVPKGEALPIALVSALTGEAAPLGQEVRRGAEIAVEEVREVKGWPVQLVVEDDGCTADGGTNAARRVTANARIVGVVGHLCSAASVPASTVYEGAHRVMISPASTAPILTARGLAVADRVVWNDEVQAIEAAKYARETLRIGTAAAVHDNTAFGLALATAFRREFERLGGRVTGFEAIAAGEADYRPTLTRLAAPRPEGLYLAAFPAEAGRVARQLGEVGLGSIRRLGPDPLFSPAFLEAAGAAAEGFAATYAEASIDPAAPPIAEFDRRYTAKFGARPSDSGGFHYHAYDATRLLLQKIGEVATTTPGGDLAIDRNALARAVRATNGFAGLTGTLTCRPTGDCGAARVVVSQVKNGRWERAGG